MARSKFTPTVISAILRDSKIPMGFANRKPTVHQLAKKFGTSSSQISHILKHGCPIPSTSPNPNAKPAKKYGDNFKSYVVAEYHTVGRTAVDIAEDCGISHRTVSRWAINS